MIMQSVRSINTMAGIRNFTIAVACGYPLVVNALGTEILEVCYIYSKDMRENGI